MGIFLDGKQLAHDGSDVPRKNVGGVSGVQSLKVWRHAFQQLEASLQLSCM